MAFLYFFVNNILKFQDDVLFQLVYTAETWLFYLIDFSFKSAKFPIHIFGNYYELSHRNK